MEMLVEEFSQAAKIKVFGVGGGGGNAVENMIQSNLTGVSFICANTDAQALTRSSAEHKIQLGKERTRGLGAGAKSEVGQAAAEESLDDIREAIGDADMVFVTAGMGGGTGTGAAPVIARVAKEKGALTVGVITKPFHFEGDKRMKVAEKGISELSQHVDSIVTIPNDRLTSIAPKNAKVTEMFRMADNVLCSAVRGVTDLITKPGLINADFADVRTVMGERGLALMGEGVARGEGRSITAAKQAITSPLLEDISIAGSRALLVNITASDLGMDEFSEISTYILEAARGSRNEDPIVVTAVCEDESLGDELHVTVIATGIEKVEPAHVLSAQGTAKVTNFQAAPTQGSLLASNPAPATAVPQMVQGQGQGSNYPYRPKSEDDYNIPAYLRKVEHSRRMTPHAPGAEDFTFDEENDIPAFIRRQAN